LVELMVVVAIVGVLATLAAVGYKKYISAAKISEPIYMAQSIRGAQESYRAETMQYLDVSPSNALYPKGAPFSNAKTSWDMASHADYQRWRTLGVTSDGPVRFGYICRAGAAGVAPPALAIPLTTVPAWPTPTEPWYIIEAQGNPRGDGSRDTGLIGSSFTGELYWENE
jgi:type IV pilus assembly protein PilA